MVRRHANAVIKPLHRDVVVKTHGWRDADVYAGHTQSITGNDRYVMHAAVVGSAEIQPDGGRVSAAGVDGEIPNGIVGHGVIQVRLAK